MEENLIDPYLIYTFPPPGNYSGMFGKSVCLITEDIELQVLYSAYMQGVFPWFSEEDDEPVVWHSTSPRFCLLPSEFHVPRSIDRFLKKTPYTYTMDKCFSRVMEECSLMERRGQAGTWIGPKMIDAYTKFHEAGYAHSFEVWKGDELAGGFYGVLIGSLFCGESMFTKMSDSSKSAFVVFMRRFMEAGGMIVDSQSYTDNMARYGTRNISREAFMRIHHKAIQTPLKKSLEEMYEARDTLSQ